MSIKQIFVISAVAIGVSLLSMFELTRHIFNWIITDGLIGVVFFIAYVLISLKFGKPANRGRYVTRYQPSLNKN
ncbi:MAG: hypothetical protein JSS06_00420 [Proteobacteria bacterium]|nr:hypothetical protein [Pseudomonadota bacterium]